MTSLGDTRFADRYVRGVVAAPSGGTCQTCQMNPKFTHSVNEHHLALALVDPLLDYVKTDAFSDGDRPLTYAVALERFDVDTSVRRLGRVLDGVERILAARRRMGRGVEHEPRGRQGGGPRLREAAHARAGMTRAAQHGAAELPLHVSRS